jgi:hypothetical protein
MSPKDPSALGWQQLGTARGDALALARDEAHWAMQLLASVGYTHIEMAPDDSQSNAGWVDGMQVLVGRRIEVEPVCFVSLSLARLVCGVHEPGGEVLEEFEFAGSTLDESYDWLAGAIASRQGAEPRELKRPAYEMPNHALATGARFGTSDPEARAELARWMHDANLVMRDLRAKTTGASLPRVWPHHFDMGMLVSIEVDGDAQQGRSIGIGLSPGDASYAEPYWYVNPYPAPSGTLPEPASGEWTDRGWTGLVLPAARVLDARGQEEISREFVDEAVQICRGLLDA